MVLTPLLFVVAMAFADPGGSDDTRYRWAWLIIGGTVVAAWFQVSFTERRLDAAMDEPMAARTYLNAYFLRLALALAPFLMGIALSFVTGRRATYFVGAALSEILLWVIAPSRRNLQRRTERFRAAGKDIDMTRALLSAGPPPRPDVPE